MFHKPADFQAFLAALTGLKERQPFELSNWFQNRGLAPRG